MIDIGSAIIDETKIMSVVKKKESCGEKTVDILIVLLEGLWHEFFTDDEEVAITYGYSKIDSVEEIYGVLKAVTRR